MIVATATTTTRPSRGLSDHVRIYTTLRIKTRYDDDSALNRETTTSSTVVVVVDEPTILASGTYRDRGPDVWYNGIVTCTGLGEALVCIYEVATSISP